MSWNSTANITEELTMLVNKGEKVEEKTMNEYLNEDSNSKAENKSALDGGLSCPIMEECQYVSWQRRDKQIMADALREIYNIRGEDKDIERIVNAALRWGCAT